MTRSANLDFFAAEADRRALLDFLFTSTDARVFESYSEYGARLRARLGDALPRSFRSSVNESYLPLRVSGNLRATP
jgi:hypothetical protein